MPHVVLPRLAVDACLLVFNFSRIDVGVKSSTDLTHRSEGLQTSVRRQRYSSSTSPHLAPAPRDARAGGRIHRCSFPNGTPHGSAMF